MDCNLLCIWVYPKARESDAKPVTYLRTSLGWKLTECSWVYLKNAKIIRNHYHGRVK